MPLHRIRTLLGSTVEGFIADEAMTRGAAIACYTIFSVAPLLVIAVAIAGTVFTEAAVWDAVLAQLRALVGEQGATAIESMARGMNSAPATAFRQWSASPSCSSPQAASSPRYSPALNVIWKEPI